MTTNATDRGKRQVIEVPVTCRLDTEEEVSVYEVGGVLQCFAQDFLDNNKS